PQRDVLLERLMVAPRGAQADPSQGLAVRPRLRHGDLGLCPAEADPPSHSEHMFAFRADGTSAVYLSNLQLGGKDSNLRFRIQSAASWPAGRPPTVTPER